MARICSCGETTPHIIAERRSSDNRRIRFWSDRRITSSGIQQWIADPDRLPDYHYAHDRMDQAYSALQGLTEHLLRREIGPAWRFGREWARNLECMEPDPARYMRMRVDGYRIVCMTKATYIWWRRGKDADPDTERDDDA